MSGLFQLGSAEQYLYHYTTAERAICYILPNRLLRMGPFRNTNDPRENRDWVFGLGQQEAGGFRDPDPDEMHRIMNIDATKLAKSACKLLCFTEDMGDAVPGGLNAIYGRGYCHPRMWAQYAEGYRGVCLVFDREEFRTALKQSFRPTATAAIEGKVVYQNKSQASPMVNDPFMLDYDAIKQRGLKPVIREHIEHFSQGLFFEKACDWEHEREFRWLLWDSGRDTHYVPFGNSLKCVIVGHRFDAASYGALLMGFGRDYDCCLAQLFWRNGVPNLWIFVHQENRRRRPWLPNWKQVRCVVRGIRHALAAAYARR